MEEAGLADGLAEDGALAEELESALATSLLSPLIASPALTTLVDTKISSDWVLTELTKASRA